MFSSQFAYDNATDPRLEETPEWEPEPQSSIDCSTAIDLLKAGQRGLCNSNEREGMKAIEAAILLLLRNPEIADAMRHTVLIED